MAMSLFMRRRAVDAAVDAAVVVVAAQEAQLQEGAVLAVVARPTVDPVAVALEQVALAGVVREAVAVVKHEVAVAVPLAPLSVMMLCTT